MVFLSWHTTLVFIYSNGSKTSDSHLMRINLIIVICRTHKRMLNNILLGTIGSLLAIALIWVLRKIWRMISAVRSFLSEFPATTTKPIEAAKKQKSLAAAFAYAEHIMHEGRFMSLVSLIISILLALLSHDFGTDQTHVFPKLMRVVFAWGSVLMFLLFLFFALIAGKLSSRLRDLRASEVDIKTRNGK